MKRLELSTLRMRTVRSSQLSYTPDLYFPRPKCTNNTFIRQLSLFGLYFTAQQFYSADGGNVIF
jgi:hypothetical protein